MEQTKYITKPVCTICDRFIKGCDEVQCLKKETILNKRHYFSTEYFERWSQLKLPLELRKQYQIDHNELKELLLSPQATVEAHRYTCCTSYVNNIRDNRCNKPPRFGLTNGFVIGYVPNDVVDEIDDVLAASIARLRIFSYVFSFVPDAHKSIKGHHTLFMNEPEQIERALQHMSNKIG